MKTFNGKSGVYYYNEAYPEESFTENEIVPYIEPKSKVKKYLYADKVPTGRTQVMQPHFYLDDSDYKKSNPSSKWFQRLDWSMIEVEGE